MKHLFFDLDGTLVDSSEGILNSFTQTFTELGMELPTLETLKTFIGPPLEASFANYGDDAFTSNAVTIYRKHYTDFGIHQVQLYQGFPEVLDQLIADNYLLYIATSKHEPMAVQMLTDLGVADRFIGIFGSLGKDSKADVINRAMVKHDIPAKDALMIGDTHYDMIGGKALGLKTIGVTWGFGTPPSLLENGADALASTPSELLKKIDPL
ncbi:HAD hydrolase-like protein [Streptococcus moroccensis]|uniref:Phosphoglycolate phosphatase n=1 Tax=Streptococcus moroccensis TaxID=1451356 RepID=A0ABT9YRE3_9STRE|nr:HAD hydrolase-like protein [Streptococcus moroccensis]MDQ0222565.1 phosphoglycolate phosphatase [Streptococcus moroccensis]